MTADALSPGSDFQGSATTWVILGVFNGALGIFVAFLAAKVLDGRQWAAVVYCVLGAVLAVGVWPSLDAAFFVICLVALSRRNAREFFRADKPQVV